MHLNRSVQYLCIVAIVFASCRTSRTLAVATNEEVPQSLAVAVSPNPTGSPLTSIVADTFGNLQEVVPADNTVEDLSVTASTVATVKTKKKINSFSQLKEMARNGGLQMGKKDLKTLNRLEKHYKGDYQKFRADAFELTDKAKIIGGIGLLGLLLAIITGSAFGWFLFVVAALAFLLRYLDIIAF